jgi:hypothetical protein
MIEYRERSLNFTPRTVQPETVSNMAELTDMKTWTEYLGHSRLRSFTDAEGHLLLEQNAEKRSKWARLAKEGHDVAWEFEAAGGAYTGRMLIDGEIYTPSEATKKFLQKRAQNRDRRMTPFLPA